MAQAKQHPDGEAVHSTALDPLSKIVAIAARVAQRMELEPEAERAEVVENRAGKTTPERLSRSA